MVSVDDRATGPHSSESRAADHERLVLEPRDVEFDWTNLPFHYVPNEPMATHVLNVLHTGAGPTTAVYVCGPPGMLEAVRVARNQHADAPLHYERFSPPPVVDGVPFELELARSRRVLRVPANRSALDVMLDWDPTTAYSCQQGFCGTCKVRVLAGQVDRRGRIIEGDNEMLVCVSRAVSGRVVIDA